MEHEPIFNDALSTEQAFTPTVIEQQRFQRFKRILAVATLALTGASISQFSPEASAVTYPWDAAQPTGRLSEFALGRKTIDSYGFAMRNCTSYAAWRMDLLGIKLPYGAKLGNANTWDDNAPRYGYPVDNTPHPGDIAVWDAGSGHVAFVESVDPRGTATPADDLVTVSEYNFAPAYGGQYGIRADVQAPHYIHFLKDNQTGSTGFSPSRRPQRLKPNVYEILHGNTRSGRTEVRGFDGKISYTNYIGGWAINEGLHSGADMDSVMGDINRDGAMDLVVVMHQNTGSGMTEVRVLDGASTYGNILGNFVTPDGLHGAEGIDYALGDVNRDGKLDLISILQQYSPSGKTEVRVLDGAADFKNWVGGWVTPDGWHSSKDASYVSGDTNGDGAVDLVQVLHGKTPSGRTEVRILDGRSNFQQWQGGWVTPEGWHDGDGVEYGMADYNGDGKPDLYQMLMAFTRSGKIEVKVLDGAQTFRQWIGGWVTPEGWHSGNDAHFTVPFEG